MPQSFDAPTARALLQQAQFPGSGQPNDPGLVAFAERSLDAFTQRATQVPDRLFASELCDFLYRAAEKTYHCQPILRCLMVVLAALGNRTEAVLALDTYLDLAAKGRLRAQKGSEFAENDDPATTVKAATAGTDMIVRYIRDAAKAKVKADILKDWIVYAQVPSSTATDAVTPDSLKSILSQAWRAYGSAYGLVARAALDRPARDASAVIAKAAFETALMLYDHDAPTYYEYAVLVAEFFHDLELAQALAEQALALDPGHLGAAHVLALALSASDNVDKAKLVCADALRDARSEGHRYLTLIDKRMVMQIYLTQLALTEATDGVQAALETVSDGIFAAYNDLFTLNEDSVESQIHEASTSAISLPRITERSPASEKKRAQIVPAASPPTIAHCGDDNDDDEDEYDLEQTHIPTHLVDGDNIVTNSNGMPKKTVSADQSVGKLPPELMASSTSLPTALLAELRVSPQSNKSRNIISRNLVLPPSLRRRLSDASLRSRKSARAMKQSTTAAKIIEKYSDGANRVLRNSLSVDEKELASFSKQCLRAIWLSVAGLFRRSQQWTQSETAIKNAGDSKLGGEKEDTFTERGLLMQAQERSDEAIQFFNAALNISIDYVPAIVGLSSILLNRPSEDQPMARDRALVLLETATHLEGWDIPEAWLLLGEIYEQVDSLERTKEVYWRCVELEESRPVRRWRTSWLWDTPAYDSTLDG
ncbi:uncharacterized protein V1518DRAFT_414702 [Limtongia smithiae]|uniref:uncharacterized protein n=1 Tax=Limtongia smithiae TaxID=1125753 RepID=UPI0034CFA688